jgi:hypothetical protein
VIGHGDQLLGDIAWRDRVCVNSVEAISSAAPVSAVAWQSMVHSIRLPGSENTRGMCSKSTKLLNMRARSVEPSRARMPETRLRPGDVAGARERREEEMERNEGRDHARGEVEIEEVRGAEGDEAQAEEDADDAQSFRRAACDPGAERDGQNLGRRQPRGFFAGDDARHIEDGPKRKECRQRIAAMLDGAGCEECCAGGDENAAVGIGERRARPGVEAALPMRIEISVD